MVRKRTARDHRTRQLGLESLEQRTMLAIGPPTVGAVLGEDIPMPVWVPQEHVILEERVATPPAPQEDTRLPDGRPTGMVLGKEVLIPDWIPAERIAAVRASMARITFGGSTAPIYPSTAESANLIGMGSFRADPDYVGVDGGGFAVVILETGIDLDHPFFGPDTDSDGVADRIVYQCDFVDDDESCVSAH